MIIIKIYFLKVFMIPSIRGGPAHSPKTIPDLRTFFESMGLSIDQGFADLLEQYVLQLPQRQNDVTREEMAKLRGVMLVLLMFIDKTDKIGQLRVVLSLLIKTNDLSRVKVFLGGLNSSERRALLTHKDKDHTTVLASELMVGKNEQMIDYLIFIGAELGNISPYEGARLLVKWVNSALFSKIYLLMKEDENMLPSAILNLRMEGGKTIFHLAVIHHQPLCLLTQIIADGALLYQDNLGKTPLHYAAVNPIKFQSLLTDLNYVDPLVLNCTDCDHETILSLLINGDNYCRESIPFVMEMGAKLDPRTYKGKGRQDLSPLHYAVFVRASKEVFEDLYKNGADLNAQDRDGFTPLHIATFFNFDVRIIEMLLQYGASPNIQDKWGNTPFHWVSSTRNFKLINQFLNLGADSSITNHNGRKALEDPQSISEAFERNARLWQQFSCVRNALGRVIECHYENPDVKEGTYCILQAEEDHNEAFTIYAERLDFRIENMMKISRLYRWTYLKVVQDADSMAAAILKIPGYIDEVHIQAHSSGENLRFPANVILSKRFQLTVGNSIWKEAASQKFSEKVRCILAICAGGRKEKDGAINLAQELRSIRPFGLVIASEKNFNGLNLRYHPEEDLTVRMYDDQENDLTVVFTRGIKYKPSDIVWV